MESPLQTGFRLRPGRTTDSEQLYILLYSILSEHGLSLQRGENDYDLVDVEHFYHVPGGMFEVLESSEGSLVGSIGVLPLDNTRCELRKLYLLLEWRGRGLGRWLLDRAICWAREQGFRYMELETAAVLEAATRLYKSFGFREIKRKAVCAECDKHFILDLQFGQSSSILEAEGENPS